MNHFEVGGGAGGLDFAEEGNGLAGVEAAWSKREIAAACVQHFGLTGQSFYSLLDLREDRAKARDIDAAGLFEKYLKDIAALIEAVDRIER